MEQLFYLMTFSSTAAALSALQCMQAHELPVQLIPIPSCVSAGCGLSLRYPPELDDRVCALAAKEGLAYSRYLLDFREGKKSAQKL